MIKKPLRNERLFCYSVIGMVYKMLKAELKIVSLNLSKGNFGHNWQNLILTNSIFAAGIPRITFAALERRKKKDRYATQTDSHLRKPHQRQC